MAVWQYSCNLKSEKNYENFSFKDFEEDLILLFWKKTEENSSHIDFWSFDSNRLVIYLWNWKINWIYCRLDMRIISNIFYNKLLEFIKKWDLVIINSEDKKINLDDFKDELKNSNSFKFVSNPISFFEILDKLK